MSEFQCEICGETIPCVEQIAQSGDVCALLDHAGRFVGTRFDDMIDECVSCMRRQNGGDETIDELRKQKGL